MIHICLYKNSDNLKTYSCFYFKFRGFISKISIIKTPKDYLIITNILRFINSVLLLFAQSSICNSASHKKVKETFPDDNTKSLLFTKSQ